MKVGMGLALMNPALRPGHDIYQDSKVLVELAETLGFDSLWTVEHHFTGHSPVPDPLQLLAYVAARTERITIGTAVLVLPWHDPLRVAEQIAMLDILSGGRTSIGFGRGSSAIEYDGFGVPAGEGQGRLAEGIDFVTRALTEELFSYQGHFYSCEGITIHPPAVHNPERNFYCAAHSTKSAALAGAAGLRLLFSPEVDEAFTEQLLANYWNAATEYGHNPGGPSAHLYVSVSDEPNEARSRARKYMTPMVGSLARHYRAQVGEIVSPARSAPAEDLQAATERFIEKHIVGTPEECVMQIRSLHERYGFDQFIGEFSYGDMPLDEVKQNLGLFASKVIPKIATL